MRHLLFCVIGLVTAMGCSADPSSSAASASEAELNGDAKVVFSPDFQLHVEGRPTAGKALLVDYALERLPQCRGSLGGGRPAWTVTGFYSENGGPAKTFDPTTLSADGKERVSKPARIELRQGGALALWFQVSNRWGCSHYDSAFGQNFHLEVAGSTPEATASIVFNADGTVLQEGTLEAGKNVKIRYAQERLPACRRSQNERPQWSIGGLASLNGGEVKAFQTGKPDGSTREAIDALLELPESGELALWFEVTSVDGCHQVDSNSGANYRFEVR